MTDEELKTIESRYRSMPRHLVDWHWQGEQDAKVLIAEIRWLRAELADEKATLVRAMGEWRREVLATRAEERDKLKEKVCDNCRALLE